MQRGNGDILIPDPAIVIDLDPHEADRLRILLVGLVKGLARFGVGLLDEDAQEQTQFALGETGISPELGAELLVRFLQLTGGGQCLHLPDFKLIHKIGIRRSSHELIEKRDALVPLLRLGQPTPFQREQLEILRIEREALLDRGGRRILAIQALVDRRQFEVVGRRGERAVGHGIEQRPGFLLPLEINQHLHRLLADIARIGRDGQRTLVTGQGLVVEVVVPA